MKPTATVVIVSDYAGGEDKSWNDLRKTLDMLSRQDCADPVEYLLVEAEEFTDDFPPQLANILPSLKVLFVSAGSSYQLKNRGAEAATADIVIFLDADCTPDRHWLCEIIGAMQAHPQAGAISGRTTYPGRNMLERILALTGRTYLNRPDTENTWSISNNNAAFRRSVLLQHPLRDEAGPFGGRLHAQRIIDAGYRVMFEPRARVVHDIEGWAMERDVRRNIGYATITMRRLNRNMPYAWMARFGYFSIPLFFMARLANTWYLELRYHRQYDVAWYELPVAFLVAIAIHVMELPGMVRAIRGNPLTETAYR